MRNVIVDVSPIAVNRTAMYAVVRDSTRHLMTHVAVDEVTALGRSLDMLTFVANDYELTKPASHRLGRELGHLLAGRKVTSRPRPDALWVVFDPLYVLTLPPGAKAIVMVLDLTPLTRPDWHRTDVARAYARAARRLRDERITLLAISESTRRDMWAHLGIPPSRVTVVPLYARSGLAMDRTPEKRLLFVGSLETRKNVAGLIKGFAVSGLFAQGYRLHIVGADAHGHELIRATGRDVPGVIFRGRLEDDDLASEYANAGGLAYPSYWEGFGLPALEAQAMGIPVLLSDSGALPELAGPDAVLVDPYDIRGIGEGLRKLATIIESDTPAKARAREEFAATMSQSRYLAQLLQIVEEVASEPAAPTSPRLRRPVKHLRGRLPEPPADGVDQAARERIHVGRLLRASQGGVGGDSHSLDYLYGIQSEARARVMEDAALVARVGWRDKLPASARLVGRMARLVQTNIIVRSMLNEALAKRLSELRK